MSRTKHKNWPLVLDAGDDLNGTDERGVATKRHYRIRIFRAKASCRPEVAATLYREEDSAVRVSECQRLLRR